MDRDFRELVRMRAGRCCEYCRFPEERAETPFHIDHIRPRQHGGTDAYDNTALACCHCNWYKGSNLTGIDPESGRIVKLFDPRQDRWNSHFCWRGAELIGLTPVGRATINVLQINHPEAVVARELLMQDGSITYQSSSVHEPAPPYYAE